MKNMAARFSLLSLFLLLNMACLPLLAAEGELKDDLSKLQGKWMASVTTEKGSSVWKLEVKGNKSTIIIENKSGEILFKGECDFKLESHGSFKAYTYSNLKNLTEGSEGEVRLTDGKTKSSLYKLESDTFITVSGLRVDDTDAKPVLIKWEKVAETTK
jgi:hypothetical protein